MNIIILLSCVAFIIFAALKILIDEEILELHVIYFTWHISEGGYLHFPILYFAAGRDGIILNVICIEIAITRLSHKQSENNESTDFGDDEVEYLNENNPKD